LRDANGINAKAEAEETPQPDQEEQDPEDDFDFHFELIGKTFLATKYTTLAPHSHSAALQGLRAFGAVQVRNTKGDFRIRMDRLLGCLPSSLIPGPSPEGGREQKGARR
jgi:hypothetical protein